MIERELATLNARKSVLARDVALLTAEPPPADIVEDIARRVLGFARPTELVLIGR